VKLPIGKILATPFKVVWKLVPRAKRTQIVHREATQYIRKEIPMLRGDKTALAAIGSLLVIVLPILRNQFMPEMPDDTLNLVLQMVGALFGITITGKSAINMMALRTGAEKHNARKAGSE